MSLGFTLGGVVLASTTSGTGGAGALGGLALLYLGPSTGRWYAGESGGTTLALRAVGGLAMVAGLVEILQQEDGGDCLDLTQAQCNAADAQSRRDGDIGAGLLLGGAALWIGTSAYDIVMAGRDADTFNRRHAMMHVAPMLSSSTGQRTAGLALEGRW